MSERQEITRSLIINNSIFSAVSWLFPILVSLVATPVIIRGLGIEAYGIFAVIIGFVSYSFTFGIGKTAAKYVAELRASGATDRMSAALSAVTILSGVIGLLVIVLVGVTGSMIVSKVLEIPSESQAVAASALFVASITIMITMLSQVFQAILQGLHRFGRFLFLTNLGGLALTVGNVILVLTGFGVFALIVWNCVLVAINACFFAIAAKRLLPEFQPTITIPPDVWSNVCGYAVSIIGYQVFGNALFLFERGWIVRKFGLDALTFYVVPMLLGFYFHGLITSLVVVLFPVVNELLNEKEKLIRLYRTATKLILSLCFLFVVTMTIAGKGFLQTWLGEGFVEKSYWILVIHVLTFAIISIASPAWQLTESFGVAKANTLASAAWFCISVPLMVGLSDSWQTEGVAAARLIGVLTFIPLMLFAERRFLGHFSARFWPGMLLRLAFAVSVAAGVELTISTYFGSGWLALLALGLLGTTAFTGALLAAGFFDHDERATFWELLFRMRRSVTGGDR